MALASDFAYAHLLSGCGNFYIIPKEQPKENGKRGSFVPFITIAKEDYKPSDGGLFWTRVKSLSAPGEETTADAGEGGNGGEGEKSGDGAVEDHRVSMQVSEGFPATNVPFYLGWNLELQSEQQWALLVGTAHYRAGHVFALVNSLTHWDKVNIPDSGAIQLCLPKHPSVVLCRGTNVGDALVVRQLKDVVDPALARFRIERAKA